MAAAGKKKKARWVAASITDIIAQPTTIPTSQNWADSVDEELESYGYSSHTRAPVVLPSASRAARGGLAVDEESIPKRPPFVAYISNLPYDVDETAITELFDGLKIQNLRLPREGDRLKGYGYVDFEDRESLIDAMNIPDLTIGGRRIRIDVSTNDNDRRMGNRGRSDRDREYDPERTMGDWRSGPRSVPEAPSRRPMDRDRERDRDRDGDSSADNRPGGWRDGERPAAEPARTPYGGRDSYGRDRDRYDDRYGDRDRGFGRDREGDRGYGGRDGFRTADRGFSRDGNRGFGERRGFGDRDRDPPRDEPSKPRERPKLNLLPRTVMREEENTDKPAARPASADSVFGGAKPVDTASKEREIEERLRKQTEEPSAPKPVSAEKVFGGAKPVDTAAKEREIEERLLKQQEQESRRGTDDRERWPRRNDHSGDRRPSGRRDDRGGSKDSKGYNRDRRDYSKDDKNRRDYSKDDTDRRRDYSKEDKDGRDDRDRRDYSKETRDRRDHSKDDRDKRDYSKDDGDRRDYSGDRDRRDSSKDNQGGREYGDYPRDSREGSRDRDRDSSRERRDSDADRDRDDADEKQQSDVRNGREERPSRAHDREDREDCPLPKLKEQQPPNFIGSNKFSFLEDADDGASD